jgi:hypothetical protein
MRIFTILSALVLGSIAAGQQIYLRPGPVSPGTTIPINLINDTNHSIWSPCWQYVWMQHADGGVVLFPGLASDCLWELEPGWQAAAWFQVPATGPGSNGSWVVRWNDVVARLDVGTPSPSFPAIHSNPAGISRRFGGHSTRSESWSMDWEVSNTGTAPHTFGAADVIRIFSPGGTVPLVTISLAGVTTREHRALKASLPISGLAPGPYTVETTWLDPATNAITSSRHGIQFAGGVDVQLPGGHVIPMGGELPVALNLSGFDSGGVVVYVFCLGIAPGSTYVPGAGFVPLVMDPLVAASVADGIGGLLIANIGEADPTPYPLDPAGTYTAVGLGVTHPGVAFSGSIVRAAAVGFDPIARTFGVSQGEDLLIQ